MRGALALALLCVTSALAQQPARLSNRGISGQVLSVDSATPLRRARVDVTRGSWRAEPVLTDNDGHFAVRVEGGGPFRVTVTKGGYAIGTTSIPTENTSVPLVVRLPRAAAISGSVVDTNGLAAVGSRVNARRLDEPLNGFLAQITAESDDRGEYRLSGLAAGRYEISTAGVFPVQKSPDAVSAHPVVTVGAGDEVRGVQLTAAESQQSIVLRAIQERLASMGRDRNLRVSQGGIRGRVVTDSGSPIAAANIRITGPSVDASMRTDADGSYAIFDLRPGPYVVSAGRDGEANWQYGQRSAQQPGRPVTVVADRVIEGIDIVLPRGGAVHGVVVDEHGEAVQGARVRALRLENSGGGMVAVPFGSERPTDDRGSYRVWALQPGSYVIAVTMDGVISGAPVRQNAYPQMYAPGTPAVSAAVSTDVLDDAQANVVVAPIPLTQIIGTARDGTVPLVSGTARLVESRRSTSAIAAAPRTAPVQMDGGFVFRNIPAGEYVLQVLGDGPGRTGLFGVQEVTAGNDTIEVTIHASHGTGLEGRILLEGALAAASCKTTVIASVVTVPADCRSIGTGGFAMRPVPLDDRSRAEATVAISANEFFVIGLFGRTAFALSRAPSDDWYLKSLTIGGIETADTGFDFGARPASIADVEITLSSRGAVLSGEIAATNGKPNSYSVVVFPQSRDVRFPFSRRVKFVRQATDGSFRVGGLPPGDYFVVAVSRLEGTSESGEWQNADLLAQLEPRSERVTLAEGQARTVTLRLVER